MIKNKRGWMRILEAFIAITLIAGFLLFVVSNKASKADVGAEILALEEAILNDIQSNDAMRYNVLIEARDPLIVLIKPRIPAGFDYDINICLPADACGLADYHDNVYANSKIISVSSATGAGEFVESYPRKISLFIWKKEQ